MVSWRVTTIHHSTTDMQQHHTTRDRHNKHIVSSSTDTNPLHSKWDEACTRIPDAGDQAVYEDFQGSEMVSNKGFWAEQASTNSFRVKKHDPSTNLFFFSSFFVV